MSFIRRSRHSRRMNKNMQISFCMIFKRGDVSVEEGKSLRDYITEYLYRAKNAQVHQFAATFDLDEKKLRNMMSLGLTLSDINEFGRFDELFKTFNKEKAKLYFEEQEGKKNRSSESKYKDG